MGSIAQRAAFGHARQVLVAGALPAEQRELAGHMIGWLFALGGVTLALQPLVPGPVREGPPWVFIVAGAAIAWGLVQRLWLEWDRAPGWLIHASLMFGLVLIAGAVASTGGPRSASWIYLFFAVIFAAHFMPRRFAYGYMAACVAVHALPLLYGTAVASTNFLRSLAIGAPAYILFGMIVLAGRDLTGRVRERAEELAARQLALRRVATAVVSGRPDFEIYEMVAREVIALHGAGGAGVLRLREDGDCVVLGSWSDGQGGRYPAGVPVPVRPGSDIEQAILGGRPVRIVGHPPGSPVHRLGFADSIVAPITVAGRVWGVLALAAPAGVLTGEDEQKLAEFGELLATGIASLEDRAKLAARASNDPLTALSNHRTLQERLAADVSRAIRHELPLAVAVLDIDQFKLINDTAGHAAGDAILVRFADCLRSLARAEDILGRVGGDEFAWVMPETDRYQAQIAVERARASLARSGSERVTVSAGICDISITSDPSELLRFADGALYWSKAHGRDQSWIYDPGTIAELSANERAEHLERSQALLGLRALARAIDAKDPLTSKHSERVARLAARLAEVRGWPAERVRLLSEAALVHDVGKIGVPDALLRKLEPLSADERGQLRPHAELSARIVDGVLAPEQVVWVRTHHERPDGHGYPSGIASDQITEGAALLSLADAWDVMTVSRPYSRAKPVAKALAEVVELTGRQFTRAAVDALLELARRGELDGQGQQPPSFASARR